jgi:formylglycine-generating enzyme required for sulfatase activity
MALPTDTFCGKCGEALEPISFDLWLKKIVQPAFERDPVDVLLQPSKLLPKVAVMGLDRNEAVNRLGQFLAERVGVNQLEFNKWLNDSMTILEARQDGLEEAMHQAETLAADRNISPFLASSIAKLFAGEITKPNFTPGLSDTTGAQSHRKVDMEVESGGSGRPPNSEMEQSPALLITPVNASAPHMAREGPMINANNSDDVAPTEPAVSESPPATRSPSQDERLPDFHSSAAEDAEHKIADKIIIFIIVCVVLVGACAVAWNFWPARHKPVQPKDDQKEPIIKHDETKLNAAPSPSPPIGMVAIQGGDFTMGSDEDSDLERPAHPDYVNPFYLDVAEVTCGQYQQFVEATQHKAPPGWKGNRCPRGTEDLPVTGVDWNDATAYAKHYEKRLPTEKEWEFAARGSTRLRYPWGNKWEQAFANANQGSKGKPEKAGAYKMSASGVYDLIGNVWEWTDDAIKAYDGGKFRLEEGDMKVIRGGAYDTPYDQATATHRGYWYAQGANYSRTGFRCAKNFP